MCMQKHICCLQYRMHVDVHRMCVQHDAYMTLHCVEYCAHPYDVACTAFEKSKKHTHHIDIHTTRPAPESTAHNFLRAPGSPLPLP